MFYDRMNGYEDAQWQNAFPGGDAALKAQTRPQASISSGRSSSRNRCSFDYRPMSRSTETSLCSVDARCRPSMDRKTLRYFGFGLDGRPVFATVGIYAAETIASRLRARPASRPALAGTRLPCNSPAGPHRTCSNPLGRRNGNAFGPSGRTQLWSQGTYTSHSRNRSAVWLPYDLDGHQPRSFGL